ncbi:MAG: type II toxin-antitoxin system VapC family toxin [Nitrosopumilus sp.]|nr:type II toxin-antitoxin system VapC family toxin [Nitrosopumilus sp.]
MSYLLDTNIVSETIRKQPNSHVIEWLRLIDNKDIYISVLTLGEIRKGVEKLDKNEKRDKILIWLENDLYQWFQGRILNIDYKVADKWGFLLSQHPSPLPAIDALIAATALTHNLKLVTRNVKDFQFTGLELINPFISK